jgi:hypothetical protein
MAFLKKLITMLMSFQAPVELSWLNKRSSKVLGLTGAESGGRYNAFGTILAG